MIEVYALAHRLHAKVIITYLDGVVGDCDLGTRTVRVDSRLTPAEMRCTAMHELAHLALEHLPTGIPALDEMMEREANEWAAERLISDELLDYAREIARDEREVAEILNVDPGTLASRQAIRDREHELAGNPFDVVAGGLLIQMKRSIPTQGYAVS